MSYQHVFVGQFAGLPSEPMISITPPKTLGPARVPGTAWWTLLFGPGRSVDLRRAL